MAINPDYTHRPESGVQTSLWMVLKLTDSSVPADYPRLGGVKTEYYKLAARPPTKDEGISSSRRSTARGLGFVNSPDLKNDPPFPLSKAEDRGLFVAISHLFVLPAILNDRWDN